MASLPSSIFLSLPFSAKRVRAELTSFIRGCHRGLLWFSGFFVFYLFRNAPILNVFHGCHACVFELVYSDTHSRASSSDSHLTSRQE